MTEYSNENRGAIWKNDRMRADKQDPQFTGSLNVEGVDYWVKAWKRKEGANPSAPALSFSIDRKDANRAPNPVNEPTDIDFDDSIDF